METHLQPARHWRPTERLISLCYLFLKKGGQGDLDFTALKIILTLPSERKTRYETISWPDNFHEAIK
jgi:hypothetical protein